MFSKIVAKMGVDFDPKGKTQEELGADLSFGLLTNLYKAEAELYELIASLIDSNAEAVKEMDIEDLKETIKSIVKEIISFFKKPATD